MKFENPLIEGRLLRRYKRFLADVEFDDGNIMTVHCPNPGAMLGLDIPGSRVFVSDSRNEKRKLRHTLEIVEAEGTLVGINTNLPNRLAREAMDSGLIPVPEGASILAEQRYGTNSRIDFLVRSSSAPDLYVEVKNVHLRRHPGLHEFPDCPTARGVKHLQELSRQVSEGNRAMMVYLVQRMDGDRFSIAADKDPQYAHAFVQAEQAGVEMLAIKCQVTAHEILPAETVTILHSG